MKTLLLIVLISTGIASADQKNIHLRYLDEVSRKISGQEKM